jgi:hypothetical protein
MRDNIKTYLIQIETAPNIWHTVGIAQSKAEGLQDLADLQRLSPDTRAHRVIYQPTYLKQRKAASRAKFEAYLATGAV